MNLDHGIDAVRFRVGMTMLWQPIVKGLLKTHVPSRV
jgi:hypothetical protein